MNISTGKAAHATWKILVISDYFGMSLLLRNHGDDERKEDKKKRKQSH